MVDNQGNDNTTCVVCFKNVLYFSIGECDHPVCFECSTRMRVLCVQNECPICRSQLSRVVFTESIQPYKELRTRVFTDRLFERHFKIGFCSQDIKSAYDRLLENCCKICDTIPPFRTFSMLSDHMRKVHERYFCDLCVEHLKIFTAERKCYTRQELGHHRRKGDWDDTSHKGHPLCEFCEKRFMDADELYRHLRKDHLYCHLCDADGRNLYYDSHEALAQHFRTDHYLCEEGECAEEHLTAVFRSEIDLKGHKATVHGRGMPRGATRQARTLELQFNIAPHPVVTQRAPRERERVEVQETVTPAPAPSIDTGSVEQFPRLSAAHAAPSLVLSAPGKFYKGADGLARTDKNFPALDGSGPSQPPQRPTNSSQTVAATLLRNSKPSVSIQLHSQPTSASNFRLTQTSGNRISIPQQRKAQLSEDDFPSLGIARDDHPNIGVGSVQPSKVASINSQEMSSIHKSQSSKPSSFQSKKAPSTSEAFPALSSTSTPSAPPQWITVSKSKEKPKAPKSEPVPQPKPPVFNAVADFPNLPANTKTKTKKPVQHHPPPPPPQNENAKPLKKERKKQNTIVKKESVAEVPFINGLDLVDKRMVKELSYGVSVNNNPDSDRKVKTSDTVSTVTVNLEKNKMGGTGDFSFAAKDYPPLSAKSANSKSETPKIDYSAMGKKLQNGSVPVPPGFKARPACNGMTFTNSSGQTFAAPVHTYIPPPDFEQRNRALVRNFTSALGSASALEDFKVASRAFRDSAITAADFYDHCRAAMGSQLDAVFSELVALLPDIAKQQELVVGRELGAQLEVCATCGQLLSLNDKIAHDTAHWPPLAHH